jgi:DNA-binding transcriptional ArsR family regulator
VVVTSEPNPLCETLFSLDVLRRSNDERLYGEWRRMTIAQLPSLAGRSAELRSLLDGRAGEVGRTWATSRTGFIVRHVLSTNNSAPSGDRVGPLGDQPAARLAEALTNGDPTVRRLTDALGVYWRAALEPFWHMMQAHAQADTAYRGQVLLAGGVRRLLVTLHPSVDWRPPLLLIQNGSDEDILLRGTGLVLQPSFFLWPTPIVLHEPGMPAVLVYPINPSPGWSHDADRTSMPRLSGLSALLGRTRAAVLEAARPGRSTTEIARCVGTSLPTASQHTSVLRGAGLITTRRHGGAVIHELSDLGAALLDQRLP